MGMDLLHGGHLTHGSPANRSGKLYNIVSYGIDPATERLDYDAIEADGAPAPAEDDHRRLYLLSVDARLGAFPPIADAVGAYLMADISHIAGMVAAGVVSRARSATRTWSHSPRTRPSTARAARCILTTDKALARKIDTAVFPGEQGGPHVNAMAGMAVAFKMAQIRIRSASCSSRWSQCCAPGRRTRAARPAGPLRWHRHAHAAGRLQERARRTRVSPDRQTRHTADG